MKTTKLLPFTLISLVFYISSISPAYAYLDPGTGSLLLQGLLGGIAGAAVFLKIYWHKLLSLFNRNDSKDDNTNDENDIK